MLFDFHVIKWVDRGNEDIHLISSVTTSTTTIKKASRSYINRSRDAESHRGFALLQSMLYHSQEITTHYWLTPLLSFMVRHPDATVQAYFWFLQHLDNQLLCSAAETSLACRTRSFMEDPWQQRRLVYQDVLTEPGGVNFAHYWFYRLEFVLWHQQVRQSEEWQRLRLTAKNSVEHISPQTPSKRDDNRADQMMDRFGNLALVSRSINSEYGKLVQQAGVPP
uniref:GmrSD restriction endonuclease domain-containing protein n=1 Tax=Cupriavidus necator TaxID=106590 RepID=UPI003F49089D